MEAAEGETRSIGNRATDVYDPSKRSKVMAAVRSKNQAGVDCARCLHLLGYHFRLHRKGLPGQPDIVLCIYRRFYSSMVVSSNIMRYAGNPDY
jgi:hypothetical protein